MTSTLERRAAEVEVRARGRSLEGYAAVFDVRAKVADFEEVIQQGAFGATLREQPNADVLALVDHDASALLGRTRNKSLQLREDSRGLHFRIQLPKTTLADDVLALADAGSLGGMSFGFRALKQAWSGAVRTLQAIDLREISVVRAWPAYPQTSVSARSLGHVGEGPFTRRIRLLELEGRQ